MSPFPRLYAIVDVGVCERHGRSPREVARAYLAGGARLLQLRAKELTGGEFLTLAKAVVDDARRANGRVIINDRSDIAVLAGADGVHVGQDDLPPDDVRRVIGEGALLGWSTHTAKQVENALHAPISYLAIGPVFGTQTKATGYDAVGCDAIRQAATRAAGSGLPVVAIGGITLETAPQVIEAGAASVAVISDLLCGDPEARVREYLALLG